MMSIVSPCLTPETKVLDAIAMLKSTCLNSEKTNRGLLAFLST